MRRLDVPRAFAQRLFGPVIVNKGSLYLQFPGRYFAGQLASKVERGALPKSKLLAHLHSFGSKAELHPRKLYLYYQPSVIILRKIKETPRQM